MRASADGARTATGPRTSREARRSARAAGERFPERSEGLTGKTRSVPGGRSEATLPCEHGDLAQVAGCPLYHRKMSGFVVMDIKVHPEYNGSKARHGVGKHRDKTTDLRESVENWVKVDARRSVGAKLRTIRRRRGQKPHKFVQVVLAGPPPYHSEEYKAEWNEERERAYYDDSSAWFSKRFGPPAYRVYDAGHRDETSFHSHLGILCIAEDDRGRLKFSWDDVVQAAAASVPGAPKKPGRRAYRILLDDFANEVGKKYGLEAGEHRVEVVPQPINRIKALEAREARADDREGELNARAEELEREAIRQRREFEERERKLQEQKAVLQRDREEAAAAKSEEEEARLERARAERVRELKELEKRRVSAWRALWREGVLLARERALSDVAGSAYKRGERAGYKRGQESERKALGKIIRAWARKRSDSFAEAVVRVWENVILARTGRTPELAEQAAPVRVRDAHRDLRPEV